MMRTTGFTPIEAALTGARWGVEIKQGVHRVVMFQFHMTTLESHVHFRREKIIENEKKDHT